LDATWARWSRPWTTIAWVFLTVGIALGSWWAYYELGWGGWWFWDPVENASFMPWLVGTALIHSLSVTEKRGSFKAWSVLLAIFTFSLSLLGTFLVRSGVLTSVHAFATDPERGLFILIFLAIVVGGSLALYAWRGSQIRSTGNFALLSRETLMLSNNVLLVVAASAVLLGTLYPLVLDALTGNKISVGPPYFNVVFMIIMTPLLVLIAIGPLVRWKAQDKRALMRTLRLPAIVSVVSFVLAMVLLSKDTSGSVLMTAIGIMLATWIVLGLIVSIRDKFRHKAFSLQGLKGLGYGFYGMWLAHLGIAVFIIGVSFVSAYSVEDDMRIVPGQTVDMAGYEFRFEGVKKDQGPNYVADRGSVFVYRGDELVAELYPEKRNYSTQDMPMTEAAIDAGLFRDLYVSLGEPIGPPAEGAWLMRVYYKPFQRWVWLACIFMALGGILAASDKRYRRVLQREEKQREADAEDLMRELLGSKVASNKA
jgi:cytochrome c-type biogenesis protein CcmF